MKARKFVDWFELGLMHVCDLAIDGIYPVTQLRIDNT